MLKGETPIALDLDLINGWAVALISTWTWMTYPKSMKGDALTAEVLLYRLSGQ